MTQVGGKLVEDNPKSDAGRRSVPIPERLMPALKARLDARPAGAPAIASPTGSRLSLENWKRAVNWRKSVTEIGRAALRVHDLLALCGRPGYVPCQGDSAGGDGTGGGFVYIILAAVGVSVPVCRASRWGAVDRPSTAAAAAGIGEESLLCSLHYRMQR